MGGMRFAWRLSRERLLGLDTAARAAHARGRRRSRRRPSDPGNAPRRGVERLTPIGFIDDDAAPHRPPRRGRPGARHDRRPAARSSQEQPRRDGRRSPIPTCRPRWCARSRASAPQAQRAHQDAARTVGPAARAGPALSQMRDMRIEDLLGRQPVQLDLDQVRDFLRGQRVHGHRRRRLDRLELARQIAEFSPAELVLLDHRRERPLLRPQRARRRSIRGCSDPPGRRGHQRRGRDRSARSSASARPWCSTPAAPQARAAARGESARGGAQQRRRHAQPGATPPTAPASTSSC